MDKKIIYLSVSLAIALFGLGGFYYLRPVVADNYANQAVGIFLDQRSEQYAQALNYLERAKQWGRDDTNLGILKGQLLAALGRYAEAQAQYELVKSRDPSSIQAVDELLEDLPT